jgi:hypothetical protein
VDVRAIAHFECTAHRTRPVHGGCTPHHTRPLLREFSRITHVQRTVDVCACITRQLHCGCVCITSVLLDFQLLQYQFIDQGSNLCIHISYNRYRLKTYPDTFVGSEAVLWLTHPRGGGLSSVAEAIEVGNTLLEMRYVSANVCPIVVLGDSL